MEMSSANHCRCTDSVTIDCVYRSVAITAWTRRSLNGDPSPVVFQKIFRRAKFAITIANIFELLIILEPHLRDETQAEVSTTCFPKNFRDATLIIKDDPPNLEELQRWQRGHRAIHGPCYLQ